jgi:hypothetical protein
MSVVAGGAGGLPRALAAVAHSADAEPASRDLVATIANFVRAGYRTFGRSAICV